MAEARDMEFSKKDQTMIREGELGFFPLWIGIEISFMKSYLPSSFMLFDLIFKVF